MYLKKIFAVMLLMLVTCSATIKAQDFNGSWSGKIQAGPNEMTIVFKI